MKKHTLLLVLSIVVSISCKTNEAGIALKNGLVIENARIISPENLSISEEQLIVIDGDQIIYIGTEKPDLAGPHKKIDAKGKFLIPGLIDSHVHVTSTDGLTDTEEVENPHVVKDYRNQLPRSYLYFGYTTLIDLGTSKPARLSQFNEAEVKPDLYYVGGGAVIGNGYGLTNWDDEIPNFIYQENEAYPVPDQYIKQNHTPSAVVKRIAESGAIAVKTYYEPGFDPTQPAFPVPSAELMETLKEEAHKSDLVLVAHGNSIEAHRFLGNTGIDIIAHGLWNWEQYRLDSTNRIPQEIREVLDTEIKNNVGYMPTLQVINGLRALTDVEFLDDTELQNVLPESLINYYKSNSEKMYTAVFGGAPKNIIRRTFNRISNQGKVDLKYVYDQKGQILFATDTPSSPTYGNPPGYNGYLEMLEMVNAGIPLGQIFASATIENAKAFNLDHQYGTIAKGKKANILLLDKNPLQDISAYNSISEVIVAGKAIERSELSAREN